MLYDAGDAEVSDGPKPLAIRPYFARLTQAMVTAVTAQMPEGRLYEVDMRLRPSGRQGPVATSIHSFRDYQMTEAWTWEHLALTRARALAGNADLRAEFEGLRREVLAAKSDGDTVLADVAEMRARLATAKPASGIWDAKNGAGRLMDIELLAQTAALRAGDGARRVEAQLRAGVKRHFVSQSDERAVLAAYRLCWRLQAASRLLTDKTLDMGSLGIGACAFLLRETGQPDAEALAQDLSKVVNAAEAVINRVYDKA
jgi:glutamate-ammonia-ligase adenylyltransferase